MSNVSIRLNVTLELSPQEYELLANWANATRVPIPAAIADAALTGITLGKSREETFSIIDTSQPSAQPSP